MIDNIVVFSHHRKLSWDRCRLEHYWKYECKYTKIANPNMELIFGSAIHKALESYYTVKRDISDELIIQVFEEYIRNTLSSNSDIMSTNSLISNGKELLKMYLRADRKSNQTIISCEEPYLIGVKNDLSLTEDLDSEDLLLYLSGKIDLVLELNNKIWIVDTKTTGRSKDDFISFMKWDEQLINYSIYADYKYGEDFGGVIYNIFLRNAPSHVVPIQRESHKYSKEEMNNVLTGFAFTAQEYYTWRDYEGMFQKRVPIPMNCSKCEFSEPSLAKRQGRDYEQILKTLYIQYTKFDWEKD